MIQQHHFDYSANLGLAVPKGNESSNYKSLGAFLLVSGRVLPKVFFIRGGVKSQGLLTIQYYLILITMFSIIEVSFSWIPYYFCPQFSDFFFLAGQHKFQQLTINSLFPIRLKQCQGHESRVPKHNLVCNFFFLEESSPRQHNAEAAATSTPLQRAGGADFHGAWKNGSFPVHNLPWFNLSKITCRGGSFDLGKDILLTFPMMTAAFLHVGAKDNLRFLLLLVDLVLKTMFTAWCFEVFKKSGAKEPVSFFFSSGNHEAIKSQIFSTTFPPFCMAGMLEKCWRQKQAAFFSY